MTINTLLSIAREKDESIVPWSFATTNPGYIWLKLKRDTYLDDDIENNPQVASDGVSSPAGGVNTTYRERVTSRTDMIQKTIELYKNGVTSYDSTFSVSRVGWR